MPKLSLVHIRKEIESKLVNASHPQETDLSHPLLDVLNPLCLGARKNGDSTKQPLQVLLKQLVIEEDFANKKNEYCYMIMIRLITGIFGLILLTQWLGDTSTKNIYSTVAGCLILVSVHIFLLIHAPQSWFFTGAFIPSLSGSLWMNALFGGQSDLLAKFRQECRMAGMRQKEYEFILIENYSAEQNRKVEDQLKRTILYLPMWEFLGVGVSLGIAFSPHLITSF